MTFKNRSVDKMAAKRQSKKERDYWLNKLAGDWEKSHFLYDYIKTIKTHPEDRSLEKIKYKLDGELFLKLMKLRNGVDINLFMIFTAGVVSLLSKYTGSEDIILGAPVLKQKVKDDFINTILPLRQQVNNDMTFKELLLQTRQVMVEATENQNCPLETLFYQLNNPSSAEKNDQSFPLFDVVVLLENIHDKSYINHTNPDIIFSFNRRETGECIEGILEYNSHLYEKETIGNIMTHFSHLLQKAVVNPDMTIVDIDLICEEEKNQLLYGLNNTAKVYPADKTIHELFEKQVKETPDNIAVSSSVVGTRFIASAGTGNQFITGITYRELNEGANQVANYLIRHDGIHIRPGDMVGILMHSSIHLVTAILGVLKSGAAYVPIDPEFPEERMKTIMADANIKVVISLKKYIRTLNRLQWECASFNGFLCLDSHDIYAEEEVEKSELMDEKLWDYVAETAVDEVTGGGWHTSYTGEPFSKQEMNEYGDNVLKKVTPLLQKNIRVLEIGCASGITMYRIAPRVALYHGTDLSGKIIEKNKERVSKEGHTNILLSHLPAHRIDEIEHKDFDLVILNSVIQSFHGHNYLGKVIRKTIDLLGDHGHLFIGDVMDHDLKGDLVRDLVEFQQANRGKGFHTKTDFSTELFVSKGFFQDLCVEIPEIIGLEFSKKICTIQNELTKYRYDLLITIDKTGKKQQSGGNRKKRKHQYDTRALEPCSKGKVHVGVTPFDPAYVIYTSGSTGAPKGVMIEHMSLVNYTWWAKKTYIETGNGQEHGTFPLYSSISFDLTVTSIYLPLLTGSTIVIYSKEKNKNRFPIQRIVKEDRVDIIKATPSHLKILQNEITGSNTKLKKFIVGGEELERALAQNIYLGFSRRVEIYNEYGPTEATVGCMIYKYDYKRDRRRSVPIGLPVDNVCIYILDHFLNPVPINGIGEIYIGGEALARGYVNQVELTAEKFISAPALSFKHQPIKKMPGKRFYCHEHPGRAVISSSEKHHKPADDQCPMINDRLYRTGDLARRLADGNVEFLGRVDEQVKIRGYRIELKEIESHLLSHSDIKEAVVIARETETSGAEDKNLCAYIVPFWDKEVEIPGLIDYLSVHMPDYMIPSYFVPVEQIPLTPNGKINKWALPEPKIQAAGDTYAAPENITQVKLVEIWSDILAIEKSTTGIDSNFFELGGHSLRATILISRIHKELNVKVPLAEIFRCPTIRELSNFVEGMVEDKFYRIKAEEKKDYYIISSAQKRLYFLQQMKLDDVGYNETTFLVFEGRLDRGRFEDTFRKLIRRHESLRTSFHTLKEKSVQRIHDDAAFTVEYHVAGSSKVEETTENFIKPFDLAQAPLIRVGLIKEENEKHVIMVDMHHIITDGTSMGIITKEFMTLYSGAGKELTPLEIQYKDFSEWQNSETVRESLEKQEAYWLNEFEEEVPVLDLPFDYPRPAVKSFEGNLMGFDLSIEAADALRELARQEEATLYMVLLAVFYILLAKLSGSEDIVVGTPIAARRHADLQHIIGMFVNTLAMRNYPGFDRTFREFLREVKKRTLDAFENQDYPFETLVEKAKVPRDTSRNPLFETMFAVQNMEIPTVEISQLRLFPYGSENNVSKFDISLHGHEVGQRILFTVEYSSKLFKAQTIERITGYFKKIVSATAGMPEKKISQIEFILDEEKKQVLYDLNNTNYDMGYIGNKTIHEGFEEQVEKKPGNIAVIDTGHRAPGTGKQTIHVTYKELNEKSNQLAHLLQAKGVQPDSIVGLMLERSVELIVGILGILKAGGAYLPIDTQYPLERIKYMIKNSGTSIILTKENIMDNSLPRSLLNRDTNTNNVCLTPIHEMANQPVDNPVNVNTIGDLVYLIYTSGSTGNPKGVMLEHQNVVNLMRYHHNYTNIDCSSVLQFSTISFDASFHEIFSVLLWGGKLCLIDKHTRTDIIELFKIIGDNRVKTLFLPMSFLRIIFSEADNIKRIPHCVAHIQTAGEQVIVNDAFKEYLKNNNVYLHNHYGPSETHVVTALTLDPQGEIPGHPSIGSPILNTKTYILDKGNHLLPAGVPGELYIGGVQVGRGYLNNPELTEKKFRRAVISHSSLVIESPGKAVISSSEKHHKPTNDQCPMTNDRLYRTGDLGRWLKDGNIEFLGRIDHQVKLRGFRVEPGEIESWLLKYKGIKQAVVMVKEDKGLEKYLCAYIVSDSHLSLSQLREYLSGALPDYMIPAHFVELEKIPLTPAGKIDRKALDSYGKRLESGTTYTAPQNDIEKKIADTWKEILQLDKVGIHDNYFELGGTSFDIIRINKRLKEHFQLDIPVVEMFRYTTVHSFADQLMISEKKTGIRDRATELKRGKQDKMQRLRRRKGAING